MMESQQATPTSFDKLGDAVYLEIMEACRPFYALDSMPPSSSSASSQSSTTSSPSLLPRLDDALLHQSVTYKADQLASDTPKIVQFRRIQPTTS